MTRKQEYSLVLENSNIVDKFVSNNNTVPTQTEFVELGGNINFIKKHYNTFKEFCNDIGYGNLSQHRKSKKYYLIDTGRNNEVIDYDTMRNLQANHFPNVKIEHLRTYVTRGVTLKWRYKIVKELKEIEK